MNTGTLDTIKRQWQFDAESRFLTLLDMTPNLVAMADAAGMLFYVNPAGRTLLNVGSDEDITKLTIPACHAPEVRQQLSEEAIPQAVHAGVWTGDSMLLTRDGIHVRTVLTLVAHRAADGSLSGFSLLERDMTAWIRTEEALRVSQVELRRLSAQHLTIQETERQRIAADLHDTLGPSLSLFKLSVEEAVKRLSPRKSDKTVEKLKELPQKVRTTLEEVRRIAMNLRPSILDDLGITAALSWFFREFESSGANIKVERDIRIHESDIAMPLKLPIFRIIQEAFNNVVKHAEARCIQVSLALEDDVLRLVIRDDGKGFDSAEFASPKGFGRGLGLQSMHERAELSGGRYEAQSVPGKGTTISVTWPSLAKFNEEIAALPAAAKASICDEAARDGEIDPVACPARPGAMERLLFCASCLKAAAPRA